jgi:hypothetical protein
MASHEYQVTLIQETRPGHVKHSELVLTAADKPIDWTHENATHWAHTALMKYPPGTRATIERRRKGKVRWKQHRVYLVGDDGIVRRTDR